MFKRIVLDYHPTRKEALAAGAHRYFTGVPCPKGHVALRMTANFGCARCKILLNYKNASYQRGQIKARKTERFREQTRERVARPHNVTKRKLYTSTKQFKQNRQRWRKGNINERLRQTLRNRLNDTLQHKHIRKCNRIGSAVRDLGCTISFFKLYIEEKFLPGMSWKNKGEWHLDHIRPLASFDLTDREQFLQACHYTNYQPLWALDNIRKWAHYTESN